MVVYNSLCCTQTGAHVCVLVVVGCDSLALFGFVQLYKKKTHISVGMSVCVCVRVCVYDDLCFPAGQNTSGYFWLVRGGENNFVSTPAPQLHCYGQNITFTY